MGVVSDKIIELVKERVNARNAAIVGGVASIAGSVANIATGLGPGGAGLWTV